MSASIRRALSEYLAGKPAVLQGSAFTASELAVNRAFVTPAELWLRSPRILRAMRVRGVPEACLTGACSDYEKMTELLLGLAETAGDTLAADIANDLAYLCGKTLDETPILLWQQAVTALAVRDVTPRALLAAYRAALLPVDVGEQGALAAFSGTIRPVLDASALLFREDFSAYLQKLSAAYGMPTDTLTGLEKLLSAAVARFAAANAPAILLDISGYDRFLRPDPYHAGLAFDRLRQGAVLTSEERAVLTAQLLRTLGAAALADGLRLVFRVRPKTEHVMGDFSPAAFKKLLCYLAERRVLPNALLTLAAGELPRGLAPLLDTFSAENAPRLAFGIDGAGASTAALRRSLRFYLSRGGAAALVGITDSDRGFFTTPSLPRFARVLAAELADFAANDMPVGFPMEAVFRTAAAILSDNAAKFYGLA